MELKPTSTVILPLEEYERMKQEIADLKEQVNEKTITKYVSRWEDYSKLILLGFAIIFLAIIILT